MHIVHKVAKGESISQIAQLHHSTSTKIKKLNGISTTRTGERLLVEVLEGEPYVVKPFDTIAKIAAVFGVCENEICNLNNTTEVYVGEVIMLPFSQSRR